MYCVRPLCSMENSSVMLLLLTSFATINLNVLVAGQSSLADIQSLLGDQYDRFVRPGDGGPPTPVSISLYVREIEEVDLHKQSMTFGMTMRYHYEDPRLQHTKGGNIASHDHETVHKFWMPDLFVENSLDVDYHDVPHANAMVRVDPKGAVIISRRFQVRVFCKGNDLSSFPMDVFKCSFKLSSYGLTEKQVTLRLKKVSGGQVVPIGYQSAVIETSGSSIALQVDPPTNNATTHYPLDGDDKYAGVMSGNYTSLEITLSMNRLRGGYMIAVFIPAACVVVLAYLTLWIDPRDLTPKILLNGIMLSAVWYLSNSVHMAVPRVPYVTATDTWLGVANTLIFFTILEAIVVERLVGQGQDAQMSFIRGSTVLWATRIEFGMKVLVPLFYLLFNIIFWSYHLS